MVCYTPLLYWIHFQVGIWTQMYPDSVLYVFFAKRNIPRYTVTCLGTHWAGEAVDSCFQVVLLGMIAHWVHNAFPYFPWLAFHTLIVAPGCFADPASILVATFLLLLKKILLLSLQKVFQTSKKGWTETFLWRRWMIQFTPQLLSQTFENALGTLPFETPPTLWIVIPHPSAWELALYFWGVPVE